MTRNDSHEARARAADPNDRFLRQTPRLPPSVSAFLARLGTIATFIGLIAIGILVAGIAARFIFGASVSTAL